MPGANFDDELTINPDGCLTPAGPWDIAADEKVLRLDVWIWQDNSACMAFGRNLPQGQRWEIITDHKQNHEGPSFRKGPATAMGLMVSKIGDDPEKTFQWTEGILLVDGPDKPGDHVHT
jgi:hypothetical protein